MKKILKIIFGCVVLVIIGIDIFFLYPRIENTAENFLPTPLIIPGTGGGVLTQSGLVTLTNNEREKQGVAILTENSKLDVAAEAKLTDMFKQQYFEHISPEGNGPDYVAHEAGYNFIIEGENLALGNFNNDTDLIAAWMASPDHRANILNPRFEDIGIASRQGTYQGKSVWMAVQEFGEPLSDCPALDSTLKVKIQSDEAEVNIESADLNQKKQQLQTEPTTPEAKVEYNNEVSAYNMEVGDYNTKSANLKSEISTYNTEVQNFNSCIKK